MWTWSLPRNRRRRGWATAGSALAAFQETRPLPARLRAQNVEAVALSASGFAEESGSGAAHRWFGTAKERERLVEALGSVCIVRTAPSTTTAAAIVVTRRQRETPRRTRSFGRSRTAPGGRRRSRRWEWRVVTDEAPGVAGAVRRCRAGRSDSEAVDDFLRKMPWCGRGRCARSASVSSFATSRTRRRANRCRPQRRGGTVSRTSAMLMVCLALREQQVER